MHRSVYELEKMAESREADIQRDLRRRWLLRKTDGPQPWPKRVARRADALALRIATAIWVH